MKQKYKGVLAALAWAAFAISRAQMFAPAYSGSFVVDNQPYQGGPILWFSKGRISAGGSNPRTSTVTLAPQPHSGGNASGRTMLKFKASGVGDVASAHWKLPSGSDGSSSEAANGEERFFSTWTPGWCIAPMNAHVFHSEVTLQSTNSQAWVDIDVQEAPKPFCASSSGSFEHTFLDNSGVDLDPQTGKILIDKYETPSVGLDFSMPTFDMHRDVVHWQDGTTTASTFYDLSYSDIWVIFDGPTSNYVFRGPSSTSVFFNPDEAASDRTISSYGGSMALDLSGVAGGAYNVHYWAVPWSAEFTNSEHQVGCASGFVAYEDIEYSVQVVPEPGIFSAFAFGVCGPIFFRKAAKCRGPARRS